MKLLVIVPAFNEQDSILETIKDLQKYQCYDFLVINDCSKDDTGKILDDLNINHIDLPVNLGLSGAVQTGFKYAYDNGYDAALQFDGDGQHCAQFIPDMMKVLEDNDIVIGSRFVTKKKDKSLRMIGSRIISGLIRLLTGFKIKDPTSGMRMLNRKMIYDFAYNMNRRPEPDTIVYEIRHGAKVKEIQVEMRERVGGVSLYSGITSSFNYMFFQIISLLFLSY